MSKPFDVRLQEDGHISMKLSGTLTNENYEELKASVEEAKQLVKAQAKERRGMVKVLFDLSDFTGVYNVGAMTSMKEMADHNRPFVAKSAIFGGSDMARIAADVTVALIGDPTIKLFKTKEEAEAWLNK